MVDLAGRRALVTGAARGLGQANYSAAKAGVIGLTRAARCCT